MASSGWRTIFFLFIINTTKVQPHSFDYPNFNSSYAKQLKLEGNASTSGSAIQLTVNATDPKNNGSGTVGRVTYPEEINLWDKSSNELKDFTTNFSFLLSSNQSIYGDGLAFFLASPNLPSTDDENLRGGGLGIGLVVGTENLIETDYQFVAVEFDTYSDNWDPDGAHVGVNINAMKSEIFETWWLNITQGEVCNCSIVYNSRKNILKVSFTGSMLGAGNETTQQLSYHVNIRDQLPKSVIVGISAATGRYAEEHTLLSWSFSTSTSPPPSVVNSTKKYKLISSIMLEGVVIGTVLFFILLGLVYILLRRINKGKEKRTSHLKMDDDFHKRTTEINYHELAAATNNFEDTHKLGQGGLGCVYKGYFESLNSYVAIKKISTGSPQVLKEYAAEVTIVSQLRHRNLMKLTGWCHKKNDLFLIYEYMPNGSLDSCLFGGEKFLSWKMRYNVALGLASALLYLQEEWEKCVVHRDIKSSNILLDSNFNPKLGDFGQARLVDHDKGSETTDVAGTMGYIAPECMNTGQARKESDIFSFGIVVLEIATGRKAVHHEDMEGEVSVVEWVWRLYGLRNLLAAVDPKLNGEFDVQQMECLVVVGLWCASPDFASRPTIRQLIKVLKFEASLPILSQQIPCKPLSVQ
ncbi:L-type lectin-domain containing receptor kinase IX.1-like [Vigna umbellata]|uniref:L-type lectin-domain containing receptor kinase IX.1-like n=1 Tax=Vigna umbellata TaxID=87088 RepID=UPI001F5E47E5|nr:L-type lectin-domain containing receptor kinase IX.1-like [Vigna umbellata]